MKFFCMFAKIAWIVAAHIWTISPHFTGGDVSVNEEENMDEYLNLLYDPCLNCYFDPQTGKYYELAWLKARENQNWSIRSHWHWVNAFKIARSLSYWSLMKTLFIKKCFPADAFVCEKLAAASSAINNSDVRQWRTKTFSPKLHANHSIYFHTL